MQNARESIERADLRSWGHFFELNAGHSISLAHNILEAFGTIEFGMKLKSSIKNEVVEALGEKTLATNKKSD